MLLYVEFSYKEDILKNENGSVLFCTLISIYKYNFFLFNFFTTGIDNPGKQSLGVKSCKSSCMMTISDFLSNTLTDNLNLFKLIQYIEKSKIAHKVTKIIWKL